MQTGMTTSALEHPFVTTLAFRKLSLFTMRDRDSVRQRSSGLVKVRPWVSPTSGESPARASGSVSQKCWCRRGETNAADLLTYRSSMSPAQAVQAP